MGNIQSGPKSELLYCGCEL